MDYGWVSFHKELARKLLEYKNNRKELIEKSTRAFKKVRGDYPKLEKDGKFIDVDPFTVIGFFNRDIKDEDRYKIAKEFAKEFNIKSEIDENFYGIPILNSWLTNFFSFKEDRGKNDIDNLWELFELALAYGDRKNRENRIKLSKAIDKVLKQRGIKWNFSQGLFWIDPYLYLNIDSMNRWFIQNLDSLDTKSRAKLDNIFNNSLESGDQYLNICEKIGSIVKNLPYKNFIEFSAKSFSIANQVNAVKKKIGVNKKDLKILIWFEKIIHSLRNLNNSANSFKIKEYISNNYDLTSDEKKELNTSFESSKLSNIIELSSIFLELAGFVKIDKGNITLRQKAKDYQGYLILDVFENISSKDISNLDLEKVREESYDYKSQSHYWTISAGESAQYWEEFKENKLISIFWNDLGDLKNYKDKDQIKDELRLINQNDDSYRNDSLALWNFANEMKIGDIVFVKKGINTIIAKAIVESDYIFSNDKETFKHIRKVKWTDIGDWEISKNLSVKALTDITDYKDYVEEILSAIENDELTKDDSLNDSYDKKDFLKEVYISENQYGRLIKILKNKKNIILQGPPGVGKTFIAKRLAYSIMGKKDKNRLTMIQFHQNYSYEDFIMGYRPTANNFELKEGIFYKFCKKALQNPEKDYYFIIDEINRGNLSKIFGELLMLIENDKRGEAIPLLYSDEYFSIPENLYIIGTMNTADRSLAIIDYALRRRFAFIDIKPAFDNESFIKYQENLESKEFIKLIREIKNLNNAIIEDESLGQGFAIGHSYFCNLKNPKQRDLEEIIDFEIIPLLKEYWFDEADKLENWTNNLKESLS